MILLAGESRAVLPVRSSGDQGGQVHGRGCVLRQRPVTPPERLAQSIRRTGKIRGQLRERVHAAVLVHPLDGGSAEALHPGEMGHEDLAAAEDEHLLTADCR